MTVQVTDEMVWSAVRAFYGYEDGEALPESVQGTFGDMRNAVEAAIAAAGN